MSYFLIARDAILINISDLLNARNVIALRSELIRESICLSCPGVVLSAVFANLSAE